MEEDKTIKLVVTQERFEEIVSIDDAMNFFELKNKEVYEYMCHFVFEEEHYLEYKEARKKFKSIPLKELEKYISAFVKAVGNAFVNPTNGADSEDQ